MSATKFFGARLNRRSWVALAVSSLSGCGGGGTDTAGLPGTGGTGASYPGTGGTGIYQGSITGFGSVIVNGVTYDNSNATMRLNDTPVEQDALRLGMVATVRGEHIVGTSLGTASSVEVWAIAQGQVSEVQMNQFKVAGMSILTNASTWFYGFDSPLSNGAYVSVWGLQADVEGETWTASCCVQASSSTSSAISSGTVKLEHGQRLLNDLRLTGAVANTLAAGALIRVQGHWISADELNVTSAQAISSSVVAQAKGNVEIEGVVTTVPSPTGFMLGNINVQTSTSTVLEPVGATIALGARVEVYGFWQNGMLVATKVELEDVQSPGEVSIKAPLQQFTSLSDFVMQGQRCRAGVGMEINANTLAALPVAGVVTSRIFKVKGRKEGDWLIVSSMELDH
jgi:hypothetical protein